nr:MAG TPA: hypothetical protein [Caudoviricetes sp.]
MRFYDIDELRNYANTILIKHLKDFYYSCLLVYGGNDIQ